jgi:Transposase DDE domain
MAHHSASPQDPGTDAREQILAFLQELLHPDPSLPEATTTARRRGRPAELQSDHVWLALLMCLLSGLHGFASIWRAICWQGVGSFPLLALTRDGVRKRLLHLGLDSLQELLTRVTCALLHGTQAWADPDLASFAPHVVALDESTLDAVRRLCDDVHNEAKDSPKLLVGKLAGLFDLRRQQWMRLQFREDALANCKYLVHSLLDGLPVGSLIICDLGYFSFPWFDWLTTQGYWWLSRLRERTSYQIEHVFVQQEDLLDALIWLGAHRADRAGEMVRLIQFEHQGICYRYLTNVLDPSLLSIRDAACLYARRWDIELAFRLLKKELGLSLWWACHPSLVLLQLWASIVLAQVLHALHLRVANEAGVDLFEVSLPVLVLLLRQPPAPTARLALVPLLVHKGRALGLIRPSRRYQALVPALREPYRSAPSHLLTTRSARYAQRKCEPRSDRLLFVPRFSSSLLI